MHGLVYNLGILSPSPHPISQSLSRILSLPPSPRHLARIPCTSGSLCSFHKSMLQTRHAPWLLLLISKAVGRRADCVFFYDSKWGSLSWLGRGGRKQRENVLMVSKTDKIQKLKMAVTAEQVNPVFFPEQHCGYLVCSWSHGLCTCLSACVSQRDGELMRTGAARLCSAYPSHSAMDYKQVLLNTQHKALVASAMFSLIKRSIKVYPKF